MARTGPAQPAADESWDIALTAGQTGRHVTSKVGTMKHFCGVHPDMTGIIHVVRE
jgi:plastocyanin